jgi:OOP family OmpA-OmpF porin
MKRNWFALFVVAVMASSGLFVSESPALEVIVEEDITQNVIEKENFIKVVDNFIVLFDASRSMAGTYPPSGGQQIDAAIEILRQQNAVLPELGWNAGLYTYTPWKSYYDIATYDKAAYGSAIDSLPSTRTAGNWIQNPTPLADGIDRLDPLLSSLSGKTAVFIFSDGTYNRTEPKKLWPMDAIKSVAENHPDTCFYFISSAQPGKPQNLLNDMAGVNACSRVIPFDDVYKNPMYGAGILFLVDSTKEVVTTTETRIAGAKVGDIRFQFDMDDIQPQYTAELDKLGKFLQDNSQATVALAGFTDNIGPEDYNVYLSQRRTESVANYLKQNFSIGSERIATFWYGVANPIADNSTPQGRAMNRRVEVAIGGM